MVDGIVFLQQMLRLSFRLRGVRPVLLLETLYATSLQCAGVAPPAPPVLCQNSTLPLAPLQRTTYTPAGWLTVASVPLYTWRPCMS